MARDIRELFLRPNKDGGAIDNPECAFGYEASAHLTEAHGTPELAQASLVSEERPVAAETDRANADIQALTATIKMLGWTLVVLAILALIFK